jgi:hypothetical protein
LYKGIRVLPAGLTLWIEATGLHQPNHFFSLTSELAKASKTALTIRHQEISKRLPQDDLLFQKRTNDDIVIGLFVNRCEFGVPV